MVLNPEQALDFFVALTLAGLGLLLLLVGRWRRPDLLLVSFLLLVATNFFCLGMGAVTGDDGWERPAYTALALDPLFLLLFVADYPYRQRTAGVRVAFLLTAGAALASEYLIWFHPDLVLVGLGSPRPLHGRFLLIGELAFAYVVSWVLALRSAMAAPSRMLAQRASWSLVAVGIAVLPRLPLVPGDVGYSVGFIADLFLGSSPGAAWQSLFRVAVRSFLFLAILAAAIVLPLVWFRSRGVTWGPAVRRSVVLVAWAGVAITALVQTIPDLLSLVPLSLGTLGYSIRWVLFAGLLVYGVLAYELLDFRQSVDRGVSMFGAVVGAGAVSLISMGAADAFGLGRESSAIAGIALGLGSAVPLGYGAHRIVQWIDWSHRGARVEESRLELYRATLEVAWASGVPTASARRQLDRERRRLGVSPDEASALEHVVSTQRAAGGARLEPGDEPIPGLVIERLLGQGSHGRVFVARRLQDGTRAVVKEFRRSAGDAAARRQALVELRALQRVRHPNLPRVHEVGIHHGHPFLVTEHVEAEPLSRVLSRGPLKPAEVARMLDDILGALAALHAAGVVHRDVKPDNILRAADDRFHLTDFGTAHLGARVLDVRATVSGLEELAQATGTLQYMAPEQVRPSPVGPAADLYALALVASEALTGRPARALEGLPLLRALEVVTKAPVELNGAQKGPWSQFFRVALAPEPGSRYPSAERMRLSIPQAARRIKT